MFVRICGVIINLVVCFFGLIDVVFVVEVVMWFEVVFIMLVWVVFVWIVMVGVVVFFVDIFIVLIVLIGIVIVVYFNGCVSFVIEVFIVVLLFCLCCWGIVVMWISSSIYIVCVVIICVCGIV